jgi:hypothetical protein
VEAGWQLLRCGQPHWPDYSCTAGRSAVPTSAVSRSSATAPDPARRHPQNSKPQLGGGPSGTSYWDRTGQSDTPCENPFEDGPIACHIMVVSIENTDDWRREEVTNSMMRNSDPADFVDPSDQALPASGQASQRARRTSGPRCPRSGQRRAGGALTGRQRTVSTPGAVLPAGRWPRMSLPHWRGFGATSR